MKPLQLSADVYRERFIAAVKEGLADSEAGRVFEDEEVKRLLDEEFGSLDEE
jgi:predicted transcriptional regulator